MSEVKTEIKTQITLDGGYDRGPSTIFVEDESTQKLLRYLDNLVQQLAESREVAHTVLSIDDQEFGVADAIKDRVANIEEAIFCINAELISREDVQP